MRYKRPLVVTEWTCSICGQVKPISAFSVQRQNRTGHRSWCKTCDAARKKDRVNAIRARGIYTEVAEKECCNCHEVKPASEFYKDTARIDGVCPECKACQSERKRLHYAALAERAVSVTEKRCSVCHEVKPASQFSRHKASGDGLKSNCIECHVRAGLAWRRALRIEVVTALGGKCACCGETRIEFLAIDHVNGGGRKHRSELPQSYGVALYVKRQGYPSDFRVLCHNCNMALGIYGYCPHERERQEEQECVQ